MGKKENRRNLTRREFLYLSGLGVAGMAGTSFPVGARGAEKRPKYGGRFRAGVRFASAGLDAHKNQDFADYLNYCLLYGGLTEQGNLPQVEIHPMLAKSWDISKDGREYTFALREGVKFHHGKELDSGDVKYSLDRVMNPATRAPRAFAFRWVESVQTVDKFHIKIRLREPFAPFLSSLTVANCAIIPSGWEPSGTKPAPGTGPFIVKNFIPNDSIEVTRFTQYWEKDEKTGDHLPYLDSVYQKKMVDEAVRWTALRAGDIDMVDVPPLNIVAKAVLENPIPGITIDYDSIGNGWIWFNMNKPPYDNKKIRQAIAYGIDKEKILKAVYWGLGGTENNQPFLKNSRFYIPTRDREVDLPRARQLLSEAGYPNGLKTEILTYSTTYDVAGCQAVVGQLKEIGIEATIKVVDRVPYYSMMRKGDYSISYRGDSERFDWDDAYYMYLHSSEIDQNNWSRYRNKEMDDLLEKGRLTMDWNERKAIYTKVVEIIREDLPIFYVLKNVIGIAFRDYVKGYRKGFSMRFAWHGGGTKYWWLDK